MSDIFGAVGTVAAASMQANAVKQATQMQINALEKQRDFVFNQLEPGKISGYATAADVQRAKDRLALQGVVDPELLKTRYAAQEKLLQQIQGVGGNPADALAASAASEFAQGSPGIQKLKDKLIDSALSEIDAGASLPSDLQAELVKAGLERGGMVAGTANPQGLAGTAVRKFIGERGLQLKAERQARAAALGSAAQGLDTARASILAQIFPQLQAQTASNQALVQSGLTQANQMVPEAGLGGSDIANIWLARVGATNQLAQSAADAAARGAIGQSQALTQGLGAATRALAPAAGNAFESLYSSIFKPTGSSGGGGGGGEESAVLAGLAGV